MLFAYIYSITISFYDINKNLQNKKFPGVHNPYLSLDKPLYSYYGREANITTLIISLCSVYKGTTFVPGLWMYSTL